MEYAICSARGCDLRSEIYVFADDCEDEEQENGNCHRYPFKEEQWIEIMPTIVSVWAFNVEINIVWLVIISSSWKCVVIKYGIWFNINKFNNKVHKFPYWTLNERITTKSSYWRHIQELRETGPTSPTSAFAAMRHRISQSIEKPRIAPL